MQYNVVINATNESGKRKYSIWPRNKFALTSGELPPYHHLEKSGRIYAYYLPQYYAWGKRKVATNETKE